MNLKEARLDKERIHREAEPSGSHPNARTLGQLLVMQSVMGSLPDETSMFSFVCKGLEDVPGVAQVSYLHDPAAISGSIEPSVKRFALGAGRSSYGELQVRLVDPAVFAPYNPFLKNFMTMLTVMLDERRQRRMNELHQLELEERAARLRDAVTETEYFAYTITHDLRGPLRAVRGYGEILLEDVDTPHSAKERLRSIVGAANRMDRLITDTLNYSKVTRQEIIVKPVAPAKLLGEIIEASPRFQPPHALISIEGGLPLVMGNEIALTQCFSNLLGNAIKFVLPGQIPNVHIRAEDKGKWVRLWFHDNGIGISRENQQKIFGMFQRLDTKYEGTGIGLALVRKAAERMSGSAGVESEEGKGSHFWLEFNKADTELH